YGPGSMITHRTHPAGPDLCPGRAGRPRPVAAGAAHLRRACVAGFPRVGGTSLTLKCHGRGRALKCRESGLNSPVITRTCASVQAPANEAPEPRLARLRQDG